MHDKTEKTVEFPILCVRGLLVAILEIKASIEKMFFPIIGFSITGFGSSIAGFGSSTVGLSITGRPKFIELEGF